MQNNKEIKKAIVLGVSGASGMIYAVRSLKFLLNNHYNVDLVASKAAIARTVLARSQ
jgi:4-hydroxy-3-polyprenylbenzoate decarboxylase